MNQRLSDGLQRILVNMLHIVVYGMPCRTEGTLLTVGIVVDNVDTWYLGNIIDWYMIVGDHTAFLLREETAIASTGS